MKENIVKERIEDLEFELVDYQKQQLQVEVQVEIHVQHVAQHHAHHVHHVVHNIVFK